MDRVLPSDVLGVDAEALARSLDAVGDLDAAVAQLLDALAGVVRGAPEPLAVEMRDAVELVEHDPSIRAVDDLAARLHRSRRTL